ncbi:MAG: ABC transporter ATP-binding protein [Bradyrhizobium sp.]|uniref:ABC transporter ATP-binding protein n=1 Tax=Bradyrhizobium sp. TaxID=376 RepID=UPI001D483606|nr:ABC transporter ATP-binding protein [Bradyrhizobium sp.]MBV9564852.1 ABC transporter ATP-binding protein [Bradyrhizobium sp.]
MIGEDAVLQVAELRTTFFDRGKPREAVRGVSFSVRRGEILGLIGESGSGKTVTGLSILRLLPEHAKMEAESIRFEQHELAGMPDSQFAALRGTELAMIFQDPVGSFNPVKTIGWHLRHAMARRQDSNAISAKTWQTDPLLLLDEMRIHTPERILDAYPHQLSGGMLQRVLIGMVLALRPRLIVADEPTTNLDNLVERQILDLIRHHQRRLGLSVLFITHDLTIARDLCDRIAVMYAGEIVEMGPASAVLDDPQHPYAASLLRTARSLEQHEATLFELPGEPGQDARQRSGCRFAARCPSVMSPCQIDDPPLVRVSPQHHTRCLLHVQ